MIRNYFKLAIRSLFKNRRTSFINLCGMTIGFTSVLLIFIYISFDLSYDQFHAKKNNIYRILTIDEALGVTSNLVGITLPPLAPTMEEEFPEIVNSVRINSSGKNLLEYDQIPLYSQNLMYTESSIFQVFDLELTKGNATEVLERPNTAVLTESMAFKLFGSEDPIGKTIKLDNSTDIAITGVMKDLVQKSHMDFDVLVSIVPAEQDSSTRQFLNSWNTIAMTSYVEFTVDADRAAVEEKMETLIRERNVGGNFKVTLQPLTDVHLNSSGILFDVLNNEKSDIKYIQTLGVVGLFVLLIASFNFMNLSTARSSNRAKEVGMRKVLGAFRHQLMTQFMGESFLICAFSFFLALGVVALIGNYIDFGIGQNPASIFLENPASLLIGFSLVILISLLAGAYPAFVLSGFKSINVIKGDFKTGLSGLGLRRVLVILQFCASIIMIVGSLVVFNQLDFIKNTGKGFDPEQIVTINLGDQTLRDNYETLSNELQKHPAINMTATSATMPGRGTGRTRLFPQGSTTEDVWIVSIMSANENFIPLMGMEMVYGRPYSEDFPADQQQSIIVNEAAARAFGWTNYDSKDIGFGPQGQDRRNVVGVIKDFYFANMRHQIEPLVIMYNPGGNSVLTVKMDTENVSEGLSFIEKSWAEINPSHPLEYTFFNEEFRRQYESDEQFAQLVVSFTWLAIFVAVLGLFGLSLFSAEQKTKEIGIRKVLGASVYNILVLLSKEFLVLILISCLIAVPIAWYFMDEWLNEFAYRIDLNWTYFIIAGLLSLFLGQITVGYQSMKTALINPVSALRYE